MICQCDNMAVKCETNEVAIMRCLSSGSCTNEYMTNDSHLYHRTNIPRPVFAERLPQSKLLGALNSCKTEYHQTGHNDYISTKCNRTSKNLSRFLEICLSIFPRKTIKHPYCTSMFSRCFRLGNEIMFFVIDRC